MDSVGRFTSTPSRLERFCTRRATAADPGAAAHSDKNRKAPSASVAIYHEILTDATAALPPRWCTTPVAPAAANDEPPPPPPPPTVPELPPPPPPPPK